jgi:DNA-binding transcriptional LysR family regulator
MAGIEAVDAHASTPSPMSSPDAMIALSHLRVLQEVGRLGSVTAAAEALAMSQPALSYLLKRLRLHYGDPLFTRRSGRLLPTPLCAGLLPQVHELLGQWERVSSVRESFDAPTSQRTFRIHMSDIGELCLLPPLRRRLAEQAPGVRLDIVRLESELLGERLASGAIDLAIGAVAGLSSDHLGQRLLQDEYVCIARPGHPLVEGKELLDPESYLRCRHVVVKSIGSVHARIERSMELRFPGRLVELSVPDFAAVPYLVAQSDAVSLVPLRLVRACAVSTALRVLKPPIPIKPYAVSQHWHPRVSQDAGHAWLRCTLFELFSSERQDVTRSSPEFSRSPEA